MSLKRLTWKHEAFPSWDGSGTVARSSYTWYGHYACRIDQFRPEEGGGFAYTVTDDGNPLVNGENESADSWAEAEAAIIALLPNIVGYEINGDSYCFECAMSGYESQIRDPERLDSRGKRIHPIFADDVWTDGCGCGECGAVMLDPEDDDEDC